MVDAATSFKKAGYSEEDSAQLALVASLYQNIADEALTAGESADFIISQMKAFNLTAADSEHIVNAVNEISNNMAVSSSDLATNIGKASAALAVGNNTYEESLALMSGIVEITRNGAKAARGLVSVQSRLNQTVDESSSTGQNLLAWYKQHNIAIFDQEGQLRSLYDVLTDVAEIWPTLTTNEKDYYLNQQAGANQTQNLAAALNNFEGVQKAYTLAMNSAGSATEENARYMESIQAHIQNLKATFQDFARNVFNEEFVKHILDTANALLEFANTPFGQAAARITLLSTAMFGLGGVLKGYWKYFVQGSAVAKGIRAFISANTASFVGPGITGLEKFVTLAKSLPIAKLGAWGAALAVAAVGIKKAYDALKEYHKPAAEYTQDIEDANSQLETNKKRLDEINQMSWKDMTADIRKERDELIKENEELEKNIALLKEKQLKTAKRQTGEGYSVQDAAGTYYGDEGYEKVASWLDIVMDKAREEGEISDSLRNSYQARLELAADQVEMLELLKANGEDLTDSEQHLIDTYYEAINVMDLVDDAGQTLIDSYTAIANTGYLTEEQYKKLISLYPDLANGAERTADGYVVQKDALFSLMSAEQQQQLQIVGLVNGFISEQRQTGATKMELLNLVKAQITASNTGLNFGQQIVALQQLAQAAGYAGAQVANTMNVGRISRQAKVFVRSGMYKTLEEAQAALMKMAWSRLTASAPSSGWSGSFGGGSYVPASSSQSEAESARQAQIKALQAEKDQIQDTIDAINKKYDAEIDKLEEVNDELEDEIELQKILEEMAEAKASKKMVYKDGKFQYVEDIDAVAAAQVKLDEYNRKKSLKDAKAAIEERRKIELKGYQDRLTIIEANINALRSGFNAELSAYDSYLDELRRKKQQELEILSQTGETSGGGSTGGGGSVIPSGPTPSQIRQNESISAMYPSRSYSTANNSQYSASFTKTLQAWYGTSADGIWGRNSYSAAGNRNIDSAAGLYYAVKNTYGSFSAFKKMGGYALGTLKASGGIHMVGEQGPELRVLNQGDGVIPAKQTQRLWQFATDPAKFLNKIQGSTTNSNTAVNVANITLPNVRNAEEFVAGLKNLAYQRAYARA